MLSIYESVHLHAGRRVQLGCTERQAAEDVYKRQHHVMVGNVDEIDVELMRWIAEAADFSANKR